MNNTKTVIWYNVINLLIFVFNKTMKTHINIDQNFLNNPFMKFNQLIQNKLIENVSKI